MTTRNETRGLIAALFGLAGITTASAGTATYTFIGNTPQTWTVPADVTRATFALQGGGGGGGAGGAGGLGGQTIATFEVSAGQVYQIAVAGKGQDATSPGRGDSTLGGWPGGGTGYCSPSFSPTPGGSGCQPNSGGGGGGGASIVSVAGATLGLVPAVPDSWLIVAGGGGGGGGGAGTEGGAGGGAAGGNAANAGFGCDSTGSGGGASGGGSGAQLQGGNGVPSFSSSAGGGGGWYGGATTSGGCGAGGGSGFVRNTAETSSFPAPAGTGNGSVTITWDNPPLVVNSLADPGDGACDSTHCTLREAISAANSTSGADSIVFAVANGTIALGSELPQVTSVLSIDGTGKGISIDGGNSVGLLNVVNPGSVLSLTELTLTHGSRSGGGGALVIGNQGVANIDRCTLIENRSTSAGGGAIEHQGVGLNIRNSVISGNRGDVGGAIGARNSMTIANTTFSANSASAGVNNFGGAIGAQGGVVQIANSTFSGNLAASQAGATIVLGGSMTLRNVLFADNKVGSSVSTCVSSGGSLIDGGGNLADDTSCAFTLSTSRAVTTAQIRLAALANNGGLTQTHALLPGSAAIDAGLDCSAAPIGNLDQRGVTRPKDGVGAGSGETDSTCDIGAFEAGPYDFGDAPDDATTPGYPTLLVNDGALHAIVAGAPYLGGTAPDGESTVTAVSGAVGDDNNQTANDEDGLGSPLVLRVGQNASIPVVVSGTGVLNAWLDKDLGGSFGSGEQIASDRAASNQTITLTPSLVGATAGKSTLRLRVCSTTGACNTAGGVAADGEVEDHQITLETPTPVPTPVPTVVPTATPSPTPTATPTPTPTATPTATATPTVVPSATPTATPTALPTATPTTTPGPSTAVTTDPSGREVVLTLSGGRLESFERMPPPSGSDDDFPDGFYVLEIDRITPGSSVTAIIDFPEGTDIREYLGCVDSECDEIPGVEIDGNSVTITLTDGGVGDSDGVANGVIGFRGGPQMRRGGGGALGWLSLLPLLAVAAGRRRLSVRGVQ